MLRVQCSNCGRIVRGGDDWSGRSGNCPKCGAVIFFPAIGEDFPSPEALAAVDPKAETGPQRLLKYVKYPSLGWMSLLVGVAAAFVSMWIWCQLIVILAFGRYAYFTYGLRIVYLDRHSGVDLSNGQHLGAFWTWAFMTACSGSVVVLMKAADIVVGKASSKALVWLLIVFAGGASAYSLVDQMANTLRRKGPTHETWLERPYLLIFVAIVVLALTYWRLNNSPEAIAKQRAREKK